MPKSYKKGGYGTNTHVALPGNKHARTDKATEGFRKNTNRLKPVSSNTYVNVTEQEISLRLEYAKSIVSNISGIDSRRFILDDFKSDFSASSQTENYRVMYNGTSWGRVSITVIRLPSRNDLQFVALRKVSSNGS